MQKQTLEVDTIFIESQGVRIDLDQIVVVPAKKGSTGELLYYAARAKQSTIPNLDILAIKERGHFIDEQVRIEALTVPTDIISAFEAIGYAAVIAT